VTKNGLYTTILNTYIYG